MPENYEKRAALSRDRWLELALDTMVARGRSKFSLDALIKAMPVGKGSFYHHFSSRAEFLMALIEHWDRHETQNVADALEALPEDTPAEGKLWELMCIVFETLSARHELLIRAMAREFPEVRESVKAVDQKRLTTVRGLFAEMGFEGDEAEMRTLAFVTTTSLDQQIYSDLPEENYRRQLKLRHAMFCRKP